jgi:4-amino-4-deoxy-L-arabinose transferase-like glycosyltransferase
MMHEAKLTQSSELIYLFLGLGIIFLFALFNHGPIPSMEPRFAEVVTEMAHAGQYLIPIKNGVPYLQYPPLYFWLGLGGELLGLPTPAAIRLPSYIALLLWVWSLVRMQKLLIPHWPPILLPLLGASLPGILYYFFTAQSDSLLILGVLIAFNGFVRLRLGVRPGTFPWELWLGITLAVAAKGPIGVALTLPPMVLEITLASYWGADQTHRSGPWDGLRRLFLELLSLAWIRGFVLLLFVNIPWYIAAGLKEGWDLVHTLIVYQNFTRFLVGFDHIQPWWYYLKTMIYDLFPISLLFPLGVYAGIKQINQLSFRLLLSWSLFTLVFLSLSQSKQGKYLLPAAPAMTALSLLAAQSLLTQPVSERMFAMLRYWATGVLIVAGSGVVFVLPFFAHQIGEHDVFQKIKTIQEESPGRIVTYTWPRAMMLYELGHPLDYVRSSRELYARIKSADIRAGDYILTHPKYLPDDGDLPGNAFSPAPAPPYFDVVVSPEEGRKLSLYRVRPEASSLPIPETPTPPRIHWWNKFDTD